MQRKVLKASDPVLSFSFMMMTECPEQQRECVGGNAVLVRGTLQAPAHPSFANVVAHVFPL